MNEWPRAFMQLETKFMCLPIPVTLGSRFGDWQVCWVGGWSKRRFAYIVMLVRVCPLLPPATTSMEKELASAGPSEPSMGTAQATTAPEGNDTAMNKFMIKTNNQVRVIGSEREAPSGSTVFGSEKELAALVHEWPMARLVEVWNRLSDAQPLSKFTDRKTAVRRLWKALPTVTAKAGQQRRNAGSTRPGAPTTPQPSKPGHTTPQETKTEKILALLRQPSGATLDSLMRATQWQAHSVRGFLSGQLGKRLGLEVQSFRRDGERVYRLRA